MKGIIITIFLFVAIGFTGNAQPNATIMVSDSIICDSGIATFVASPAGGSYSYQWLINGTVLPGANQNIYVTGIAGAYSCIVSDITGSDTSSTITLMVNPTPVISLPPNATICAGNSIQLCAGGGGIWTYQWSNGAVTQCINVSTAGIYTITVANQFGCIASASTAIIVMPLPTAILAGSAGICIGDQANLTISFTGTPPFTYSYDVNGAPYGPFATNTNPVIITVSPFTTSVYSLTSVADVCGPGTVSGSAVITVNPLPFVNVTSNGPLTFCVGDSVQLVANSGVVTYQWYRNSLLLGATTQSMYARRTGDYVCVVTDLNGCISPPSFAVHVSVPCIPMDPPELKTINDSNMEESTTIVAHDKVEIAAEATSCYLYNILGVMVEKGFSNNGKVYTSLTNHPNGIYFLKIISPGNKVITRRIVKN